MGLRLIDFPMSLPYNPDSNIPERRHMSSIWLTAKTNLHVLKCNGYPGRGLVMGVNKTGTHFVQVYWIMGRSANSRNRIFAKAGGRLFTKPANPAKVEDASLIIYNAMDVVTSHRPPAMHYIVSNGSQTDTIGTGLSKMRLSAYDALKSETYEPDAPNYTPRISGVLSFREDGNPPLFQIGINRKAWWDDSLQREFFSYDTVPQGTGLCVTTYDHDERKGQPLPTFSQKPYLVELGDSAEEILHSFWDEEAGYFQNLVSVAVKMINTHNGASAITIMNKYAEVSAAATK